ncbi:hyaluronidase-2 isoform X2 [Phyllopteryx taeniolatus]|uniref:hyaluronidase-2 isoform X2 n=1 Tax=Phyllopteryx taeniolatus TaxID=161469 RepID=UPI002AD3F459|nr:hyaluronidase-2 isoform X2 [Phyllopteryx taeniolatus]
MEAVWRHCLILTVVTTWAGVCVTHAKQTKWPLYSQTPVLLVWNAPTQDCAPRHGVTLPLDQFDIVASPNEGFVRQNLTIFYKERLGLYPYYERDGTAVNGGLPQLASLSEHYDKMPEGVQKYIREPGTKGLAVIDWEEWRPLWIRNWDSKDIYRNCYNHDYRNGLKNYTGRCPTLEMGRNDQLNWLWMECTALFPSIYMGSVLRSTHYGRLFVRNRVKEAMRLASVGDGLARPVFVYTRPTYISQMALLTETDLVSTIGESIALGVEGVIFWGDSSYSSDSSCSALKDYLNGALGRYLLNVSTAAQQCSRARCNLHGRCLRSQPDDDAYLHLSPSTHSFSRQGGRLKVSGEPGEAELALFRQHFQCQCYTGYQGEACALRAKGQNKAPSVLGTWSLCFLLPLGLLTLLQ